MSLFVDAKIRVKALLRPIWRGYVKWPMPLWRLRGYGDFELAGESLRFHEIGSAPHDWWAWKMHDNIWESSVIAFFAQATRPGDVVFDIGAHTGPYSLLAARLVGPNGWVHAFEPDPVARSLLERNIATNQVANITVVPLAIGAEDGWASLEAGRSGELGDSGTIARPIAAEAEDVTQVVSLQTYCREHGVQPSVIKIDVEGAEADVLADSATAILKRTRVVLVEIHDAALRERGSGPDELVNRLSSLGGDLRKIDERWPGNHHVAMTRPL